MGFQAVMTVLQGRGGNFNEGMPGIFSAIANIPSAHEGIFIMVCFVFKRL